MSQQREPEIGTHGGAEVIGRAERYGTGMLRRFGWFHWLLGLRRPIDQMRLDDASVERIRTAAQRGPIVYVMLQASDLDHLALNRVLNARRLPLSIWANDVTMFFWEPVAEAWSGLFRRAWARLSGKAPPDPVKSGFVEQAVRQRSPLTVFLEPRRTLWRRLFGRDPTDPLPALLRAQEGLDEPVQLLPVLVVWQRGLDRPVHPAVRAITPDPDRTWGLYRLWKLAWYASDNFVQVGEPLDLREFETRVADARRQRRTLYVLLRRYLRRETRVVRGPRLPAPATLKQMVLDNPPMRELARTEAARSGSTVERVQARMGREYDRIAAHMRWWVIRILDVILRPLWTRVYSGVDAPEEDMERIREAMRDGAAIVLPSHKSHFDYMLLAWVFYNHKLTLPHVVAGANLALPVLSFFLRSAGGFFIKRSFAGEHLHPPILSRYIRELVGHGVPIEFYLEGGRTRSGKLLPPKIGILGMIFEAAALRPSGRTVTLLPVALAYEQVAEQHAYVRELGGQEKRKENLSQFARATRVMRRRLGRVYLRVGEPVDAGALVDERPEQSAWLDRDKDAHKDVLQHVAHQVMYRVGQRTVLLPTSLVALALLAHHRRGIRQDELLARVTRFRALVKRKGVPEAASLEHFDEAVRLTLARLADQRIIEHFEHDGERVWAVRVDRRLDLDFAKNQGLHAFTEAGLVAAAARAQSDTILDLDQLDSDHAFLCDLWRRELTLDPDATRVELLQQGLDDLEAHGAIARSEEGVRIVDGALMGEILGLYRPFIEGYRVVLDRARTLDGRGQGRKEWVKALQKDRDALLAAGLLTRPEALSLVTLENAVKILLEDGVLTESDDGLRGRTEACNQRLARLTPMVGP